MKIQTTNQQPAAQQVEKKGGAEAAAVQKKTAARKARKGDTVELSASLDAELSARQAERAQRVQAIKAEIKGGTYKVDSREVAKKMLSGSES